MEQVSHNELILIYWKWKWLAWWTYTVDGVLQPPVCTEFSASLIMIILVHMTGLLELWIDGCARPFHFLGFPPDRQSAKCRSITLAKQEERISSFVIYCLQELGEVEGLPTVHWPPVQTCWANIYDRNYLLPLVLSYFCIAYLEMSNDSWNHISTVTVQIYGFSLVREPFPD